MHNSVPLNLKQLLEDIVYSFEYIDNCDPNLLMYRLQTINDNENESGFVRHQGEKDIQIRGDHEPEEKGHK